MTTPFAGAPASAEEPRLSVIVPAFNEEENIVPLSEEIIATLAALPGGFELIVVDDASTDSTASVLEQFSHPCLRRVFHRINCGQSSAVASGFQAARGVWVATLDGDGQNDPADLPAMLAQAEKEGVDCVTGVRRKRQERRVARLAPALLVGEPERGE